MTKDEALDLALEALDSMRIVDFSVENLVGWNKAITAIKQALAAPVSMTSESAQGVEQDERVFARIAAMKKPPAAQPAPVQEPVGNWIWSWLMDWCKRNGIAPATQDSLFAMVGDARNKFESTPPAQPAPVQEPVAWVTAEDVKVFNTVQGESVFLFQKNGKWNVPLYTTPLPQARRQAAQRPWIGLTDLQIDMLVHRFGHDPMKLVIELTQELKEKNNG